MIEVPVSRGKRVALIDDADLELVADHSWTLHVSASGNEYARCQSSHGRGHRHPCRLMMHNLIAGCRVDHANRNGLDNRRGNLRVASKTQNAANQRKLRGASRFKGVSRYGGRWLARIGIDGRSYKLGAFRTQEEAAQAYDAAAQAAFGDFACTNQMLGLL